MEHLQPLLDEYRMKNSIVIDKETELLILELQENELRYSLSSGFASYSDVLHSLTSKLKVRLMIQITDLDCENERLDNEIKVKSRTIEFLKKRFTQLQEQL